MSAPYKDQPPLDRKPEDLNPCERKIFEFFNDPTFVAKLVEFLSLEERKGKDKFDALKFSLFKVITNCVSDSSSTLENRLTLVYRPILFCFLKN